MSAVVSISEAPGRGNTGRHEQYVAAGEAVLDRGGKAAADNGAAGHLLTGALDQRPLEPAFEPICEPDGRAVEEEVVGAVEVELLDQGPGRFRRLLRAGRVDRPGDPDSSKRDTERDGGEQPFSCGAGLGGN
jgi:hypothetical protein